MVAAKFVGAGTPPGGSGSTDSPGFPSSVAALNAYSDGATRMPENEIRILRRSIVTLEVISTTASANPRDG
ncbi:hypothetical protein D3C71_1708590 [compost metagenome]